MRTCGRVRGYGRGGAGAEGAGVGAGSAPSAGARRRGARRGNQAQRQMALATRPRSTWRRSTSVTERSPRGCMGQEPAKGACACQRRSRTPDVDAPPAVRSEARGGAIPGPRRGGGESRIPPRRPLVRCEAHHETSVRPAPSPVRRRTRRARARPCGPVTASWPELVGNPPPGRVSAASRPLLRPPIAENRHFP
jgi:hypothetical protein